MTDQQGPAHSRGRTPTMTTANVIQPKESTAFVIRQKELTASERNVLRQQGCPLG